MGKRLRLLCVDDHAFLRDGLSARLRMEPDIEVVGQLDRADDLVNEALDRRADVVLLDIDMPGRDPFEAVSELSRATRCRVIFLTGHSRDHFIDRAFDSGAWGFFSKQDSPDDLINGIRQVGASGYAYGPSIQARLAAEDREPNGHAPSTKLKVLTPREREVLVMIGKGMSRADIARAIHRSFKTVDAHHTSLMRKLDIHDRAELAVYAVREGIVA